MQQYAELTAASYRAVRCPRIRWLNNMRLLSCSLLVEGGQLQAEPPVICIKLVDLAAEQFDLGIHDIGRWPGANAVGQHIVGKILPGPA